MSNAAFLSYRRSASGQVAHGIATFLQDAGIDVFFDIDSIRAGKFGDIITHQIEARPYFLPVLSVGTLDRCGDPDDWVRREIEHALSCGRIVVPIVSHEFDRADIDHYLPPQTAAELGQWNCVDIPEKLRHFTYAAQELVDDYLLPTTDIALSPLSDEDEEAAEGVAARAAAAGPVTAEALDAEDHLEHAFRARDDHRLEDALGHFDALLELTPGHIGARLSRALVLGQLGDIAEAKAEHDRVFRMDPTATSVRVFIDGQIARDPLDSWAYVSRGLALGEIGELEGAIADFVHAAELDETNDLAIFNLGATELERGDPETALGYFNDALAIRPASGYYLAARGSTLLSEGYDGAEADFALALHLEPDNPWIYTFRADAYLSIGEVEAALADIDHAILVDPRNPVHYTLRGTTWLDLDDLDAAFADFTVAIELDPTNADALRERGAIRLDVGDPEGAIVDLGRAIDADQTDRVVFARTLRAAAHAALGDDVRAAHDLRVAAAIAEIDDALVEGMEELLEIYREFFEG